MKMLFHCYEFPPQAGGVGRYMEEMAHALAGGGVRCIVATSRSAGLPEYEATSFGCIHRFYDRNEIGTARVAQRVVAIAKEHRVGWIECADHHGEAFAVSRLRCDIPLIVKIHGSNPVRVLQRSHELHRWQRPLIAAARARKWRQTLREHRSIACGDLALVPSCRMLEELRVQRAILPAAVEVVPNPIRVEKVDRTLESIQPTVLMVGRLDIGKGIEFLPSVVRRVRAAVPDVVFECAGESGYARGIGSLRDWLERRLGEHRASVRFLGRLDSEGITGAYTRAWVVMVPSRWDNFPTVVLEAMARSRAIVASPNGGMPEMLAGTGCVIAEPALPEFSDAIVRFLVDRTARETAARGALDHARSEYAPDAVILRYLAVLRAHGIIREPSL